MPGENPYTNVPCYSKFDGYELDWNIRSKRPKKDEMVAKTVYLYYGEYSYKNEPYQGPCYAVLNSKGIIQRGQLKFALDQSDPQNIGKLLASGRSLHLLPVVPSDFKQYKNSYLFINEKKLIYVDQEGKTNDVLIKDMALFKNKLRTANSKKERAIKLDSKKIEDLITSNGGHSLPLEKAVFDAISQSIKSINTEFAGLDEQYRFLLADFKAELELRHAYNRTLVAAGSLTQELFDEFKEDAEDFLESIEDAVTPDFHKTSMISQLPMVGSMFSNKDPTGEKIKLINQALMRGRMALEVPASTDEMDSYKINLKQMKNLSKEISGHSDARMKKIGICLVLFAAFSLGMAFAAPTFGASLFLSAAAAATMASIMTIAMPISGSFMGMIGLGCVISGIEKGPASGLSNFEETAEEVRKISPR